MHSIVFGFQARHLIYSARAWPGERG